MKPRAEVVKYLVYLMDADKIAFEKGSYTHFGYQELREFLDYLYNGPPTCVEEELRKRHGGRIDSKRGQLLSTL